MLHIYIDADACPVKDEVYRVAARYGLSVTLVANSWMRTPREDWLRLEVVAEGADAADDWIVERVEAEDIVITADIPLAARCLKAGARALGTTGRPFTEDNIGHVLATRDLMTELRDAGAKTSGPPPLRKQDRSLFLQQLDQMIQAIRRANPEAAS
ncbi:MAG: YaiI/YqxD family protein [Candidatus Krumholzibacteriia bacterium]|nr:YaiI/YqxD family protein [bacterium]